MNAEYFEPGVLQKCNEYKSVERVCSIVKRGRGLLRKRRKRCPKMGQNGFQFR